MSHHQKLALTGGWVNGNILSLGFLIFAIIISRIPQEPQAQQATSSSLFSTFASFNASDPECITSNGTRIDTGQYTTFGSDWADCKAQILSDYRFLASHNMQVIRIWPVLSTFAYRPSASGSETWGHLNNYITNLDQALTVLQTYHMKAYVTLLATPDNSSTFECTTALGYYFSPDIVQNQAIQDAYINSLTEFIQRYKNNTTIAEYDIISEINTVINHILSPGGGLCGLFYDNTSLTKLTALINRIHATIKSIDTLHPITFSAAGPFAMGSVTQQMLETNVDFYDIHLYSLNPVANYQIFPIYDKPVVQGEVGINQTVYDSSGLPCETDFWNLAPMMNADCQQIWLTNTQTFVQQAQLHHVQNIFFSYWPTSRWFGIRTDNGTHKYLGHQMTSAGQYILNLAMGTIP